MAAWLRQWLIKNGRCTLLPQSLFSHVGSVRFIYGDDGSTSRNPMHSSSPIHVYSDSDDDDNVANEDHFPSSHHEYVSNIVDEHVDASGDHPDDHPGEEDGHPDSWGPWGNDTEISGEDDGPAGYGDEESVYGDEGPASGDEYEYGDEMW